MTLFIPFLETKSLIKRSWSLTVRPFVLSLISLIFIIGVYILKVAVTLR